LLKGVTLVKLWPSNETTKPSCHGPNNWYNGPLLSLRLQVRYYCSVSITTFITSASLK